MKTRAYLLHVEDNSDDVELTRIAFRAMRFPYEVVVARDGAQALDFLFAQREFAWRDKAHTPALILLDLNLPKLHGLEVLERIRADRRLRRVTVVVLTSSSEEKDRTRAAELGASLYLQKPVSFDQFRDVIARIAALVHEIQPAK